VRREAFRGVDMAEIGDYVKDIFFAGIGIFSLTKDRIEEIVDKLVKAGKIEKAEADELISQLGDRAESERRQLERIIGEQVKIAVKSVGLIGNSDVEKLTARLEKLEKDLKEF
jgi:polyhydroxyalkanoate synthesis regulator phasin